MLRSKFILLLETNTAKKEIKINPKPSSTKFASANIRFEKKNSS